MQSNAPAGQRADARRNRESILRAAREAFADPKATVSLAEVSRRADVGMATLYRNFSSRQQLLEALYAAEADAAFAAPPPVPGASAGDALRAWLRQFFAFACSKKYIAAELLTHVNRDSPIFDNTQTRVLAAGRPAFDRAQRAGQIRADLTLEQLLQMLVSIATIEGDGHYQEPILQTVLDGLTPPSPTADSQIFGELK